MRNDLAVLNRFVEALSRESSAFDFPHRGKKLVADREVGRDLVLDILRGSATTTSCPSSLSLRLIQPEWVPTSITTREGDLPAK